MMKAGRTAVTAAAVIVTILATASALGVARADESPAAGTPGAPGVGDTLFPGLGNGGYDAASYDVSFDYHPGVPTMPASVAMRATATQALSRFDLDSVGQAIASVTVDGRPARFAVQGEELVITPAPPLRKG